ncbi:CASP-like protein [Artemisia annua]|uniref:CASP-like protein n=1 Tax=Artemisia annua TaxID=35608 RepID=A0A2U1QET9_ARTAN|nr:CASP-like protein [Artemisia annua]
MSSIDTTTPPKATTDPKTLNSSGSKPGSMEQVVDVALRVLLFATALVGMIVMVASKQTKLFTFPGLTIPVVAKFSQSPAFTYLVAALSVACLYSIITVLLSVLALIKKGGNTSNLQFYFVMFDVVSFRTLSSVHVHIFT